MSEEGKEGMESVLHIANEQKITLVVGVVDCRASESFHAVVDGEDQVVVLLVRGVIVCKVVANFALASAGCSGTTLTLIFSF